MKLVENVRAVFSGSRYPSCAHGAKDVRELATSQRLLGHLRPHPTQANNQQPAIDIAVAGCGQSGYCECRRQDERGEKAGE
jgi:hypothetical protein